MVEAMPENIKKNFIYRICYNKIFRRMQNVTFIILGDVGSGKSSLGLKLCSEFDPSFNINRICYTTEDFLNLLANGENGKQLPPGSAILYDEVSGSEDAADSRSAMSRTNKIMSYVSTTYRVRRLFVCYCSPFLMQIDKNVRSIGVTGLFQTKYINYEKKKCCAEFSWVTYNSKSGDAYYKHPRVQLPNGNWKEITEVFVSKPPQDLVDLYEKKKDLFLSTSLKRWHAKTAGFFMGKEYKKNKISVNEIANKVRKNKDSYMRNNRISKELVMKEFDVSINVAASIAKIAAMEE